MEFTSNALKDLGEINGPRCCKRDAMISFKNAIDYVNTHYHVTLEYEHSSIGRPFDDNCGLEDPAGKSDEEFVSIIKQIETKILDLKENLKN